MTALAAGTSETFADFALRMQSEEVTANADGITVTTPGTRVTAAPDVSGIKAGSITVVPGATEIVPVGNTGSSGGTGGGGGSGGDSDDEDEDDDEEPVSIVVTAITVTSEGGTASVIDGGTLQLYAEVSPANATDKTLIWSVESLNGGAADIDASGLLTATDVGTVRVTASNTASGVIGTKDIEVTAGETAPTPEEYFEFDRDTGTITDYRTEGGLDVVIPDMIGGVAVTHIGAFAFIPDDSGKDGYINQLTSVVIPETVESIGDYAFIANHLTLLNIPGSITYIGEGAFIENQKLESINVDPDNSSFSSHEGVLYNKEQTALLLCPYRKAGSYTIPDTVTSIADFAFKGCTELTEVDIPESLNSIGEESFYNCAALTNINIPYGVTSISSLTFYFCSELTSVVIPESVTSIGDSAFGYCTSLTGIDLPDSITSIGDSAFGECQSLTDINLPDGITSIGDYAFVRCSELSDIDIPNELTSINSHLFFGCGITSITIPEKVTSIGYGAFLGCNELREITIPNGVEIYGDETFINGQ